MAGTHLHMEHVRFRPQDEAALHYDEKALAALAIQIAPINAFNRFNATTRQPVGAWR